MKTATLAFSALICVGVNAQQSSIMYSGQDLLNRMTSSPDLASGYVAGVADAL